MPRRYAMAHLAHKASCHLWPLISFGRIQVAPWDDAQDEAWRIKRMGRLKIELGPILAGRAFYVLIISELFSLVQLAGQWHRLMP